MIFRPIEGPRFSHTQALSSLQSQVDRLVGHFVTEASEPTTLLSLTAGSLAYRVARFASAGRLWSIPFSFSAEVGIFETSNRVFHSFPLRAGFKPAPTARLWSWTGPGGLGEGLASSAITLGLLKGAGFLSRDQNLFLHHSFQIMTLVSGRHSAGIAGFAPKPEGSLVEQILHAQATLLQLQAGMGLVHPLAPGLQTIEMGFDLKLRALSSEDFFSPFTGLDFAQGGKIYDHPSLAKEGEWPKAALMMMTSKEGPFSGGGPLSLSSRVESRPPLSPSEAFALGEKWKPFFPLPSYENNTDLIFSRVLDIPPFGTLRFHDVFFKVLSERANVGSLEQYVTVKAIKNLIQFDSLRTGVGSFQNLRLHWIFETLSKEKGEAKEANLLSEIIDAMETGTLSEKLDAFFQTLDPENSLRFPSHPFYTVEFWRRHLSETESQWGGYRAEDQVPLFNFVYALASENTRLASRAIKIFGEGRSSGRYSPKDIDQALDFARRHPQGMLVLYRLFQVFVTEDNPGKLKEFSSIQAKFGLDLILRHRLQGLPSGLIAELINGTELTGFIDDLRLARKVVSLVLDTSSYLLDPSQRLAVRVNLDSKILDFVESRKKPTPQRLFELLRMNPSEQVESMEVAWRSGILRIETLSAEEMDAKTLRWEPGTDRLTCLFQEREPEDRDRILLREMPMREVKNREERTKAYFEWMARLLGMVHEGEHWRHFSGNYVGLEAGAPRIILSQIHRDDRLLSEMLAYLEYERWSARNYTTENWEISRRLGETLPLYLRSYVDLHYFQQTHRNLLSKVFETSEP
jgi:hypothetical protein